EPRTNHFFHSRGRGRQDLVGRHFVRLRSQPRFDSGSPCQPQFGVDVNYRHAGLDRTLEIVVVGARSAVQCHEDPDGGFDLRDPRNIQPFLHVAVNHAREHSVHVADRGGQHVNQSSIDELLRLLRRGQNAHALRNLVEHSRRRADPADLALDKNRRVDRFDRLDRLLCLGDVFLDGERRPVEADCVESRFRRHLSFGDRVSVVGIQKNWKAVLVANRLHQRRGLPDAGKLALALRYTHHDGQSLVARGGNDRVERDQVRKIKMTDGNFVSFGPLQYFTQRCHIPSSPASYAPFYAFFSWCPPNS